MKILIAVITCHKPDYTGHADPKLPHGPEFIMRTWLQKAWQQGIDVRFFFGGDTPERKSIPGEYGLYGFVHLDAPDDYAGLPQKVWKMLWYAFANDYDFVLKVDDDMILKPAEWLASDFRDHDYVGTSLTGEMTDGTKVEYAAGFAYVLSRKGMAAAIKNMLRSDWAEDKSVGHALGKAGIKLHQDDRYQVCSCEHCYKPDGDWFAIHTANNKSLQETNNG